MVLHFSAVGPQERGDQSESHSRSAVSGISPDKKCDSDFNSVFKLDNKESSDDNAMDNELSSDEGELPPEHYRTLAENLVIPRAQQERYSDGMQAKLDRTKAY
ncbi:hypothetical protein PENFLA_c002G03847 [Penicillium flavigenum]|uniref:Uncharacterized protein n=1 Tax=Penicillium flavigenum TaxID=254877 RepID=A0A1V6TWP2_9EURO|nr:hypothetical protein PENFLA_c002G03847 [Penicillium flavigenum]